MDIGSNDNLMSFTIFRILFSKSTIDALHTPKKHSFILKTYNQSGSK